jgi:hypothetical protein
MKGIKEPPYINLIFSRYILLQGNRICGSGLFSHQRASLCMTLAKIRFNLAPDYKLFHRLCASPNFRIDPVTGHII